MSSKRQGVTSDVSMVFVLLAAGLAGAGCSGPSPADPSIPAALEDTLQVVHLTPEAVDRADLELVPAQTRALSLGLQVTGRIQLDEERSARVGSPVEGRVTRIDVVLGDVVGAGAALLHIHAHELASARADYFKATSAVSVAERRHRYAVDDAERAERLFVAKAISKRDELRAAVEREAAFAELEQARAELQRAEEVLRHLGSAPDEEGELIVRAPMPGTVLERNVTLGTVVSPADDLVVISDLSSLWVAAEVPEREAARVRLEQSLELTVPAYPERSFTARIFYMGQVLDPQTRTVKVRARVDNTDAMLRPEMYANIRIQLGDTESLLAIPADAVQEVRGEPSAFVALGGGRFERRLIQTGQTADGWIEITSGLTAGERVVSTGSFLIKSEFLRSDIEEE